MLSWAPSFYFLFYAAAAAIAPFIVLYYQDLGLTGTQIGFLAGIPPLVSLFSATAWGIISDVTQRHKVSLLVAIGGAILMVLALPAFKTFAWLVPAILLFAFFFSPIMPLVDSTTMNLLGDRKEGYGRIRLWGAVGWGITAPLAGWIINTRGAAWMFWGYAGLMALGLLVALRIPVQRQGPVRRRERGWKLLAKPGWLVFLSTAFFGGVALSMISNFLLIFLRGLGADEFLLGLTMSSATLSEIPIMYFSARWLRAWEARRLMRLAMLFFALRALACSFIQIPWLALLVQLLHGPSFSLMWLAGVAYADENAPAGLSATTQGLFSGTLLGIGSAVGALLGGMLYDHVGILSIFQIAGVSALLGFGLMTLTARNSYARSL